MRVLLPLGLLGLLLCLYAGRLSGPFVFDDHVSITDNASIRSLALPGALIAKQATATAGRPLVNLSFALNYAAAKLEPFGYHAVNLGIHFACSWLVFLCLARLFAAERNPERLRRLGPNLAAIAAVLFAVHPVAVEIVLYTTQRTEGMVSLFFLLTCYAFLRYAGGASRQGGAGSIALAGLAAFAGALSKATIVAILPLLVLCDRAFFAGSLIAALRARYKLYAAVLASYAPLVFLQSKQPWGYTTGFWDPLYLLAQGRYVFGYLCSTFWPRLALDHGDYAPRLAEGAWPYAIAVACIAIASAVWIVTRPRLGFVGAWVFALLAPTSSVIVIHTEVAADRRIYLPLVALLGAAVAAAGVGLSLLAEHRAWSPRMQQALAYTCCTVAVLALFAQSAQRTDAFTSEVAFWEHALFETPENPRAAYNLGEAYQRAGRKQDAVKAYETALYHQPQRAGAHLNLGALLMHLGRRDEGLAHLRRAVELAGTALAHYNYALALIGAERLSEARAELERALALKADYAEAHLNLGMLLMSQGESSAGLSHLARGVALRPEPQALHNYAIALAKLGRNAEAQAQIERARQLHAQ